VDMAEKSAFLEASRARARSWVTVGVSMADKMLMMEMTTISSIKVKPVFFFIMPPG